MVEDYPSWKIIWANCWFVCCMDGYGHIETRRWMENGDVVVQLPWPRSWYQMWALKIGFMLHITLIIDLVTTDTTKWKLSDLSYCPSSFEGFTKSITIISPIITSRWIGLLRIRLGLLNEMKEMKRFKSERWLIKMLVESWTISKWCVAGYEVSNHSMFANILTSNNLSSAHNKDLNSSKDVKWRFIYFDEDSNGLVGRDWRIRLLIILH